MSQAIRTAPPVGDLRLVDLVAPFVDRRETRGGADCAVDIDETAADSTDQMMMVVADAILEAGRRAGRLNAPDQAFGDQDAEGVVHRLQRDGADFSPDDLGHAVGRDVGLARDRLKDGQSLRRHLDTALPKEVGRVSGHGLRIDQFFESFKD
jgi:hypothetical protein